MTTTMTTHVEPMTYLFIVDNALESILWQAFDKVKSILHDRVLCGRPTETGSFTHLSHKYTVLRNQLGNEGSEVSIFGRSGDVIPVIIPRHKL
jgi:glutathionylspermidine synthase